MCVTRTRLEEASSQTHQSEKVDHIGAYTSVVTGGRNSGFENSVKKRDLLLKEGLEATKRWRQTNPFGTHDKIAFKTSVLQM